MSDGQTKDISLVVEHLFRHESGKMVATLTRIFGIEHLTLAEDAVQEALERALRTWPFYGIPENAPAWLMRVARNRALDVVRREKSFHEKQPEIIRQMEEPASDSPPPCDQDIVDDRLRMMFVSCHPSLPQEAQVALVLKTLGGFNVTEISRAFLTTESAIAKRLTRAKQKIRDARIPFEIPTGEELVRRLEGVLQSLYLLFNEGYKASTGDKLMREETCQEAIRLAGLLVEHPAGNCPKTHALLALMLLNAARSPARVDGHGNLLLLQEQDRSRWHQPTLVRGMYHLSRSAEGNEISRYHLQAGIVACHCVARDFESTDWNNILALYDRMMEFDASPVVALNRAVAVANVHGPKAGLDAVAAIPDRETLESYYLYYAVLGEFESRLNEPLAAAGYFRKSLQLAQTTTERQFLSKRFSDCEDQIPA